MLKTRVITAIVLLAVLVPVTVFAPINWFGTLIGLVVVFGAWEWARLLKAGTVGSIVYAIVTGVRIASSPRSTSSCRRRKPRS